jgi:hypothetical protein
MRFIVFALACLAASTAAAQTPPQAAAEVTRAMSALSAIWRPITGASSLEAACAGAREELDLVDSALPPVLTPQSLARVRALSGLVIVPTGEDPAHAFFFPDGSMTWFASGVGVLTVINETEGFLAVRDAQGHDIALQLGNAGGRPMLRVRPPSGGTPLTFVGCAASTPQQAG